MSSRPHSAPRGVTDTMASPSRPPRDPLRPASSSAHRCIIIPSLFHSGLPPVGDRKHHPLCDGGSGDGHPSVGPSCNSRGLLHLHPSRGCHCPYAYRDIMDSEEGTSHLQTTRNLCGGRGWADPLPPHGAFFALRFGSPPEASHQSARDGVSPVSARTHPRTAISGTSGIAGTVSNRRTPSFCRAAGARTETTEGSATCSKGTEVIRPRGVCVSSYSIALHRDTNHLSIGTPPPLLTWDPVAEMVDPEEAIRREEDDEGAGDLPMTEEASADRLRFTTTRSFRCSRDRLRKK